jgi:hypothetical protein
MKSRMDFLQEACNGKCSCNGQWMAAARDVLANNGIPEEAWRGAMLFSFEHGRSKGTLVCHAGLEGNEGKSWLLEPIELVFGEDKVFNITGKAGFPLLGLEKCRVVVLDDWRFNEDLIGYPLQLLWFEGKPVVIARPQNQFSGHLKYTKDAPIFITTLESDITKLKGKKIEIGDTAMMMKRLKLFRFHTKLEQPRRIPACACCFARFVLGGSQQAAFLIAPPPGTTATKRPPQGPIGSTPASKRGADWDVQHVVAFLERLELGHLAPAFRENGVDGAFLLELTHGEMISELGLTPLQAKKVMLRFPK